MAGFGNQDEPCRFCFAGHNEDGHGPLISPCRCSGSQKHVHRSCLDKWRVTQTNNMCFTHCTTCHFEYRIKQKQVNEGCCSKRNTFYALVARDFIGIALVIQTCIAVFAGIVFAADKGEHKLRDAFGDSVSDAGAYYLAGLGVFLVVVGAVTLALMCMAAMSGGSGNDMILCYCCWGDDLGCDNCNCGSGGGCQGGSGDCDGDGAAIVLIIVLVVIALVGVFVITYWVVSVGTKVVHRHMKTLEKRLDAREHIVVDLKGMNESDIAGLPTVATHMAAYASNDANEQDVPLLSASAVVVVQPSAPYAPHQAAVPSAPFAKAGDTDANNDDAARARAKAKLAGL